MAKNVKKVNPKDNAKNDVIAVIVKALADAGYVVKDGKAYGMTAGTLIIDHPICDVQLKPIVPKTGVERYQIEEEE